MNGLMNGLMNGSVKREQGMCRVATLLGYPCSLTLLVTLVHNRPLSESDLVWILCFGTPNKHILDLNLDSHVPIAIVTAEFIAKVRSRAGVELALPTLLVFG